MTRYPDARRIAAALAAVADPTRIRLIEHLLPGPQSVGKLAEAIGVEIVNTSHHLGVLRNAGLVTHEKRGRFVDYRLAERVFTPADGGGAFQVGTFRLELASPGKKKG